MLAHPVLLFDFGGTLADIHPRHEWLYVRACRESGIELAEEHAGITDTFGWEPFDTPQGPVHREMSASEEAFRKHKTAVIVDRLERMGVQAPPDKLRSIAARVYQLDTEPEMYRVYEDVFPALEALTARGHRSAIISNHEWGLPDLITGLGLGPFFEHVVSSARIGCRKPHPEIFRHALGLLERGPQDALMIGDSVSSDVTGALRMGMNAVLLDRNGTSTPVPGVRALRSLSELLEFL